MSKENWSIEDLVFGTHDMFIALLEILEEPVKTDFRLRVLARAQRLRHSADFEVRLEHRQSLIHTAELLEDFSEYLLRRESS